MPPRKKSGRITLRMDPDIHARVEKAAKALGLDINGLLNPLIRTNLPYYESLAAILQDPKTATLFAKWQQLNPSQSMQGFVGVLSLMLADDPSDETREAYRFENRKWYEVNAAGDDFVEVDSPSERYKAKAKEWDEQAKARKKEWDDLIEAFKQRIIDEYTKKK